MTNPTAQLPNDAYYEGLRKADSSTFEVLYSEMRKPITRAVESAGGSSADGNTFFRVAVIQASMLAREHQLDESVPAFELLKNLAIAHFRDWATEKGLELPVATETEAGNDLALPDASARLDFRSNIKARRQLSRLDKSCQKTLLEMAKDSALGLTDPRLSSGATAACVEQYRQNLGGNAEEWAGKLPAWTVLPLSDEHFQNAWSAAETLEARLSMGHTATPPPETKNTRNVLILLCLLALCYWLWTLYGPSKTPKAVYEENYKPPSSIMVDREARAAKDSLPLERNEICEQLFEEADRHYKKENYPEAAGVLYTMVDDEMETCKSDALFYLAIIGLQVEQPEITLECLAKIPDLDRFGEDLYWYQALAFVKIAAQNPTRREVARRAVERARSNTELPERRAQAEKMLEQLKE